MEPGTADIWTSDDTVPEVPIIQRDPTVSGAYTVHTTRTERLVRVDLTDYRGRLLASYMERT